MPIGLRIRQLREEKGMSQGDIEEMTGLLRSYVSRVENGHTIPSLETLERFGAALGVPVYRFFYEGDNPPATPNLTPHETISEVARAPQGDRERANTRFAVKLNRYAGMVLDGDREILLAIAKRLAMRRSAMADGSSAGPL
jgi:transcriptional regulator with XRE-family HTH domain